MLIKKANKVRQAQVDRLAIKSILASRDLYVADLARALGVSKVYLGDMLHGKKNVAPYIPKIAALLGVPERRIVLKKTSASRIETEESKAA